MMRSSHYYYHHHGIFYYCLFFLAIVVFNFYKEGQAVVVATATAEAVEEEEEDNDDLECGLYLAPSTIPGTGLGMFAGRSFASNEPLQQTGDVVVPVYDIYFYHPTMHQSYGGSGVLLDEYTWSGHALMMSQEVTGGQVEGSSSGFGAAVNCVMDLYNIDEKMPDNDWPLPNHIHRSNKDPGVGAFSVYHNRKTIARYSIQPGQELFANYGDDWFINRTGLLGPIPVTGDIGRASKLFQEFLNLKQLVLKLLQGDFLLQGDNTPSNTVDAVFLDIWKTFIRSSSWKDSSRVLSAFTSWNESITTDEKLLQELETFFAKERNEQEEKMLQTRNNTTNRPNNNILLEFKIKESTRTQQYLKEFGTCADNIKEGISTLSQAGRGGFATRPLHKDSIIAQLPLIHLPNRNIFEQYKLNGKSKDIYLSKDKQKVVPTSQQLLLNYCMGHAKSTLLLCNYGPMVTLINHNQTLANVKLQWTTNNWTNHQPDYLNRSLDSLVGVKQSVLAMELVALEDINKGEELFLDYGDEWEQAWKTHVENWKPPSAEDYYQPASYWNEKYIWSNDQGYLLKLRSEFEQVTNPYPGNIQLMCDLYYDPDDHIRNQWKRDQIYVIPYWTHCEILSVGLLGDKLVYDALAYDFRRDKTDEEQAVYHDYYFGHPTKHLYDESRPPQDQYRILQNLPKEAFRFFDRPYTTDMFLPGVFRHDIRIPDELFPKAWYNK